MLRTLRRWSILSHVLPVLIIVPLMGIALIYVLETQVLLTSLSKDLQGQALLAAQNAKDLPDVWHDAKQAQAFVIEVAQFVEARAMLLDSTGRLLASSDAADVARLGQQLEIAGWATVLAGQLSTQTTYSQRMNTDIVDVLVPVMDQHHEVVGVVRLSRRLTSVYERFLRLRYLIAGVMMGGLFLGAVAGWFLTLYLQHPLQQVTQTVSQLISGERSAPLPERGPQELVQLAHSVNTLVERLHTLEETQRQLLANLVHELGRPLGALRSAIQALLGRSGGDVAVRQELLVGMDEEVGRLQRLLDDLVGLHGQVMGTLQLNRQATDVAEWLTHTLGPWREAARAKGLHWEVSLPDALPNLEVDSDRLAQALGNLVSNAINYTPPKGTVSVSAGTQEQALWIRVSDTGPGIAPEEQERIFVPFYRSQPDRRFPQGMGLGLSIARALVAAHGGWLELQSESGVGSHFTIWIPLGSQQR